MTDLGNLDVKAETNKDGSGKGQWSAWKATKLSKEYEAKGGDYENEAGSKNEPVKGAPHAKSNEKKDSEGKAAEKKAGSAEKSDKENEKPAAKKSSVENKSPAPAEKKTVPKVYIPDETPSISLITDDFRK